MNKLILQILNSEGEVVESKSYKSLKHIERELKIEYFALRALWLMSNGKKVKNLHQFNDQISKKYRIINEPCLLLV